MRFIYFFLLFLISQCTLSSQAVITKNTAPKSALKLYQKGVDAYKIDQYQSAINYFEKAIHKAPNFIDAELQWASVCFDMKDYACAERHFQSVLKLDSAFSTKVYYTLALSQYQLDHFKNAKDNISLYLNKEHSNQDLISKARLLWKYSTFADSAIMHPNPVTPAFLESLNSEYSEYLPSVSADGKTAVFTRRSFRGDEDLYISHYEDSVWSEPVPIKELNEAIINEGSPALSQDGSMLIFTICDGKFTYGGCDLFISEFKNDQWGEPHNMGDKINSPAYESNACFAENGNAIYFTSNRKGTIGGYDIWVSRRKKDRSWSIPKNLGSTINTPGDEVCPFVHPNGSTLYFSSDYFPGMGGRDIFYSIADEKGNWQTPVNLGYPINSKGDESSFVVFPDGKTAWMASDKKYFQSKTASQHANLDLYEMTLPQSLSIKSSTYVEIEVTDKSTGKPIPASVSVFDLSNNKSFYNNAINGTGKLLIALPTGANYGLHIYHKDYIFIPDQFNCIEEKKQYDPMIIHKKLERISNTGSTITLKNIFFETGSAVLKSESQFELNALIQFLKDNNNIKIKIIGHTDDIGTESDNQILSEKRAAVVINYLKQQGIAVERLISEGKGETSPIDDNATEKGRQNNRRIEFTIL